MTVVLGEILRVRCVLARMPDIHASCVCCLGSRTLTAYDGELLCGVSSHYRDDSPRKISSQSSD